MFIAALLISQLLVLLNVKLSGMEIYQISQKLFICKHHDRKKFDWSARKQLAQRSSPPYALKRSPLIYNFKCSDCVCPKVANISNPKTCCVENRIKLFINSTCNSLILSAHVLLPDTFNQNNLLNH